MILLKTYVGDVQKKSCWIAWHFSCYPLRTEAVKNILGRQKPGQKPEASRLPASGKPAFPGVHARRREGWASFETFFSNTENSVLEEFEFETKNI